MANRQILLVRRPEGPLAASATELVESPIPAIGEGQALVRVGTLSIDPTIRTWMNDAPGYLPAIDLGAVVRSTGAGIVTESRSPRYQVGDIVTGMTGWQEWAVADDANRFSVLPSTWGVDLPTAMNVLGVTGLTAYFGLLDVGRLAPGEVVVVSGAAGATGSLVGQLARQRGASRVIGIAGGPEKCARVVDEYHFDDCVDYRAADWPRHLRRLVAPGIDVFFDNVGGEVLDVALTNLARGARVVMCGAISQYDRHERPAGIANTSMLIVRRASMTGFLVLDFLARAAEAYDVLVPLVHEGAIVHHEHLVSGLERAPDALHLVLTGGNQGKMLVVVDPSVTLA